MAINDHHGRCEQINARRFPGFEMQFYCIKCSPEIVPVGRPNEPLITIGQCLTTSGEVPRFRTDLNVALPQVESVISLRAERAGDIRPLGKKLTRVLSLSVEFQPFHRLKRRADPETLQKKGI